MFKKLLLFALFVSICTSIFAQQTKPVYLFCYFKDNGEDGLHLAYSHDAYNWTALKHDSSFLKPTAGDDKLMRDPCIIKGPDGLFHMVWTVSWHERSIGYASSPDLIHWSKQQSVPVMAQESTAQNCWAPEIIYDNHYKGYMIFWATTIPGRFPQTDSSGDSHYNHRIYYTLTKDFKTYTPTKLLFDPGYNCIDATIKKSGNRYIMFYKNETRYPPAKNIHVAFSIKLTGGYSHISAPITGKNYWAEGPTVININGRWIVYFDKYRKHTMGAVTSTDFKHWNDISDQVHFPEGTRHGTVFTVSQEELDKLKNE